MAASISVTTGVDPVCVDWSADRARVDAALCALCDQYVAPLPRPVADAIRYSLLGGGKRLRPILMLASYRAAGGRGDASPLAAAVEVVHAYSLVHDDLPCMDDDDVRRGRPATHRRYGVPVAMAAGLAMVPLAARCGLAASGALELPAREGAAIVRELMRASGAGGMVGGQLLDLTGEGRALSLDEMERMHSLKTGSLIVAAARIGGLAAGAHEAQAAALDVFGAAVGLAFQIADDVLDATSTTDQLGKTAGRDAMLRKSTYPALLGVEGAVARARALADQGSSALDAVGLLTPELRDLARFAVSRRS